MLDNRQNHHKALDALNKVFVRITNREEYEKKLTAKSPDIFKPECFGSLIKKIEDFVASKRKLEELKLSNAVTEKGNTGPTSSLSDIGIEKINDGVRYESL